MLIYALWRTADAYEGADICLGIYSDYVKARAAEINFLAKNRNEDVYVTKISVNEDHFNNWEGSIGELVA